MYKSDEKRLRILLNRQLNEQNCVHNCIKNGYALASHQNGEKTYYEYMGSKTLTLLHERSGSETIADSLLEFVQTRFKPIAKKAGFDVTFYDFDKNIFEAYLAPNNERPGEDVSLNDTSTRTNIDLLQSSFHKRSQNVKKVDLLVKNIFHTVIPNDFVLTTDTGDWKPVKDLLDSNGKMIIFWENKDVSRLRIETTLFPDDTNDVMVEVKDLSNGEVVLDYHIEVYVIPTTPRQAEVFLRKVLFNQLKRWIDREVIRLEPFKEDFAFWKASNPDFPYSFKTPNKNTIVLDLINFVSTAQNPILDDFVEQNNLKHKQNYLRALLDSAEEAGIFRFDRVGNEIKILKGVNFNDFLAGKVRRVV